MLRILSPYCYIHGLLSYSLKKLIIASLTFGLRKYVLFEVIAQSIWQLAQATQVGM